MVENSCHIVSVLCLVWLKNKIQQLLCRVVTNPVAHLSTVTGNYIDAYVSTYVRTCSITIKS